MLQALRAALRRPRASPRTTTASGDATFPRKRGRRRLARRDERDGTAWDQPLPPPRRKEDTESLADALVGICADYLRPGAPPEPTTPTPTRSSSTPGRAITARAAAREPTDAKALAALAETVPLLTVPRKPPRLASALPPGRRRRDQPGHPGR